jgi:hypothetical protein
MNFLDKLTSTQRQVLVRLPYRVGLWISQSDSSGGPEADERERQTLYSLLHGFSEDMFGAEAIQYIMSETLRHKEEWPNWGDNIDMVPGECRDAIELMRENAESKDAKAFKTHLLEIAEAVAGAFREENISAFSIVGTYVSYMFMSRKKGRRNKSFDEFLNISPRERKALSAITKALEAA